MNAQMNARLDELRRKRAELIQKKEAQRLDIRNGIRQTALLDHDATASNKHADVADGVGTTKKAAQKYALNSSSEISLLAQKQEDKKLMLEEGIMADLEMEIHKLQAEDASESSSDSDEEPQNRKNRTTVADVAAKLLLNKPQKSVAAERDKERQEFKVYTNEELETLVLSRHHQLSSFFSDVERMLKREIEGKAADELIEDYIFNQDKDVREQKEGCTMKKVDDPEVEGKYMVNDILWLKDSLYESEKLAICYSKLMGQREGSFDKPEHFIGVYKNDRRLQTKTSRVEIKKISGDEDDEYKIWGGLENGRVALWDLRNDKSAPDVLSKISEKANFLPVVDIKKREDAIFTVGREGRLCKWDARKLEEPVSYFDFFCLAEGNNIAQLESMPMSLTIDPVDPDTLFVSTFEGSVYEVSLNANTFQQRNFLPDVHSAPITRLKFLDFKGFFRDQTSSKKSSQNLGNTGPKFVNHILTCSFDWSIKLFKGSLANEIHTFRYHNDFVTDIAVNRLVCPFTFASADSEGRLAVWRLDSASLELPIFEWTNPAAISNIAWNKTGLRLAIGDVRGNVTTLTFPRSKLALSEKAAANYFANGVLNLKPN